MDAADFSNPETSSFIGLNDAFRKTLLKAVKKTLRQHITRAEFSLIRALISFTERIMGSNKKRFLGGGGRLIASEKLVKVYLLLRIQ